MSTVTTPAEGLVTSMLEELRRLVTEVEERVSDRRHAEALASLVALEPIRDSLAEYCGQQWIKETSSDSEHALEVVPGYL